MAWKWMVSGWGRHVALTEPGWAYNFIPITTAVGRSLSTMLVVSFILNKGQSFSVGAVILYMAHLCSWERASCVEDHSQLHHGGMLFSSDADFRS